jgi:mRNA interferase RelE/StbE
MYSVRFSPQLQAFVHTLAPTPRRALRTALGRLAQERGDLKALEGELAGYWRLSVGRYRVIFCYIAPHTIDCIFAEERQLVYEAFSALLRERLERG